MAYESHGKYYRTNTMAREGYVNRLNNLLRLYKKNHYTDFDGLWKYYFNHSDMMT